MKKILFLIVSASLLVFSSCDTMNTETVFQEEAVLKKGKKVSNYVAHLSGSQEVPAVETEATGQAVFQLSKSGTELHFKLIVANIEDVAAAHIHGAPVGVNGGVIVGLYTDGEIPGTTNGILAEGAVEATESLLEAIEKGNAYVNVHTTANPGGEIRGQISTQ